ncbi:MAG: phosphatidylserine/phosphatidylglycerophosphate/cardiolipin synthase family protein [Patescibacteria group bacterium]
MNNEENKFFYKFYRTTKEAWDAMYSAVLDARVSVYWELYMFADDEAGNRFVDILCEKAKTGVDVKLIFDSIGSYELSSAAVERLRKAGAEVKWFNQLLPEWRLNKWFSRLWKRNHRKVLIIDEETSFLGGVNVSAGCGDWDDLYLQIKGKLVRPLLRGFAKSYARCGGDKEKVKRLLHPKITKGLKEWRKKFHFFIHSPMRGRNSSIKNVFFRGLSLAKESFNLVTPYYVPDKNFLKLITKAKKRGVKVNVFLPLRTDHKIMEWIAMGYFELTQKAGASVYLLRNMHHGKGMSVDGKIGFVGSANFTPRGFFHNEESCVYFSDEKMVKDLNDIFEDLKSKSDVFDLEKWKKRGALNKIKEWVAEKFKDYV